MNGKHYILLAVYGDRICRVTIWGTGDIGRKNLCPACTSGINVLCSGKDFLPSLKFFAGQRGIDLDIVDIPITEQVTPQGNFGGVVSLIFIFQAQLTQAAGRIAICDNAHDFGVAGLFFRKIFNAFPNTNGLRDTGGRWIHTVCGNFFDHALGVLVLVIGVDHSLHSAINGQIGQLRAAVININLAQGFFYATGSRGKAGTEAQQGSDAQQKCNQSPCHGMTSLFE